MIKDTVNKSYKMAQTLEILERERERESHILEAEKRGGFNLARNGGITLIGLVITIVIMLILTGITINLLFGDNGIITKTKMAKKAFLGEDARQVVEDRVNAYLAEYGTKGDLSLYDFWFMYNSQELEDGSDNPNYDPNFVIYLFEEAAAVNFTPSVQTGVYDKNTTYSSAVVIYKGYSVTLDKKLTVKGKAKAVADLTEAEVSKLENKQIYTVTPTLTGWANQKTLTPVTIQGSTLYIDASGSMEPWNSAITVDENKTLNYEVRSGANTDTGEIVIDKIDTVPPTVSTNLTGTVDGRNVNLSIGVTDNLSGYAKVEFYHKLSTAENYTNVTTVNAIPEVTVNGDIAGVTTATTVNGTIEDLADGTYDIYAKVYDVAGNVTSTKANPISVEVEKTLSYTWPELSALAQVISNDSTIDSNTASVTRTIGTKTYTVSVGDKATVYINSVSSSTSIGAIPAGYYKVRILGFNHDTLADPKAYDSNETKTVVKAGISFEFVDVITTGRMNSTNTNSGGWNLAEIKGTLNGTVLSAMKQTSGGDPMLNVIKTVNKDYMGSYSATALATTPSTDSLWLLSCGEIWSDGYKNNNEYPNARGNARLCEGTQYKYYANITSGVAYNSANPDIKKYSGEAAQWWWLRSPGRTSSNSFCVVNSNGYCNSYASNTSGGVSPGFSI